MVTAHANEIKIAPFLLVGLFSLFFLLAKSQSSPDDSAVMFALRQSLNPPEELAWSDSDPCKWSHVACSTEKRVTRIQIGNQNLKGTLPSSLSNLTQLERLELQGNSISGPLPTLSGLSSIQVILLSDNHFSSIPPDFFVGMTSLQSVDISNNPFSPWEIPDSLKSASALQNFSANSANITGTVPTFFGPDAFPGLQNLHLALNRLNGGLPPNFSGLQIESLWLNGQNLSGGIDVIHNMTLLNEIWLHANRFSGPLPDFSSLKGLETLNLRQNSFTGPVPSSLVNLDSLKVVNLTNNLLQGPMPQFKTGTAVDMIKDTNSFCLPQPGDCDPKVNTLLSIAKSVGYPQKFAENWKGNNPCTDWIGITCNDGGNITVINFGNMGLTGTISPVLASLTSLQRLLLGNNNLTGTIPQELTTLPVLNELDVSNNHLYGKVPAFRSNIILKTNGNPDIGKDITPNTPGSGSGVGSVGTITNKKSGSRIGVVIGSVIGSVAVVFLIALITFCSYKTKQKKFNRVQCPNGVVIHPPHSVSDNDNIKISVAGADSNLSALSETDNVSISGASDMHMMEGGNMVISIQVLRNVTGNFSEDNILGRGGFGTVYKGELHDGTKIAVKRMESSFLSEKGLAEFKSEIAVLTKVRHRHLVALLGYCLDGNEKLLVFEYMPQGTLSRHLFNWASEGLKPLEWMKRLTIALDVARGVEYLHSLAQQSFIHRDLKPSNILLGDDMRAKVGDFGLVRLAPEGKGSIETKIAGTFGYLAPEYAVTGRVTTKVDVYAFGVILMELITGRKALDESQAEESVHLVTWFRRSLINKDHTFRKAIDPTIDLDEETFTSVNTVAELAGHCCAREPYQRPDMAHAVNVLSSLVEHWKPSDVNNSDDLFGIDLDMSLPQALRKWKNHEDTTIGFASSSSTYLPSMDNTQTSIPARPHGFTDSFTSADGR